MADLALLTTAELRVAVHLAARHIQTLTPPAHLLSPAVGAEMRSAGLGSLGVAPGNRVEVEATKAALGMVLLELLNRTERTPTT